LPNSDTISSPPTVKDFIGIEKGFQQVLAGHRDNTEFLHTVAGLSPQNLMRLQLTPKNGGNRLSWKDTDLQIPAYAGKDDSIRDIYGRMYWDRPAPTITTKFHSVTNGRFAHPDQNRGLSLREGATLQTFDVQYKFKGSSIGAIARLIGNAVPPELSKRIAEHLYNIG
jgi:DNA (cytosine-5)-methyltransferase 1